MKADSIPFIPNGFQYQVQRDTYPSPISSVDDLSGLEISSRQNQYASDIRDTFKYTASFLSENKSKYSGPALVFIKDGDVVSQATIPQIFNPAPEIQNAELELDKFVRAMNQKGSLLIELRKNEAYSEIETAAKYFKEYSGKVQLWTNRLEQLRKDAPGKIQKSIDDIKLFEEKIEAAKLEVIKQLETARGLKKQYETAAK